MDRFLAGKLLVAMPNMDDPRFHRAVILVCAHDENGAMGLMINHILPGMDLLGLMDQLNIEVDLRTLSNLNTQIMNGGPVESGRGFIIHGPEFKMPETVTVTPDLCVTGTIDALRAVAAGKGPQVMSFMLGYAGWEPGQLEREVQDNVWLLADADADLIFNVPAAQIWGDAVKAIGVDPGMLSAAAGRA
jgi:putative transcriptional regulator